MASTAERWSFGPGCRRRCWTGRRFRPGVFRLSFGGANTFATAFLGSFPILFGLSFWQGLAATVLGLVLGALLLSPMSLFGPINGTNNGLIFNRRPRGGRYWFEHGWNWRGLGSWLVAAVLGLCFTNIPEQFVGPLGELAGGVDIGLPLSMVMPRCSTWAH